VKLKTPIFCQAFIYHFYPILLNSWALQKDYKFIEGDLTHSNGQAKYLIIKDYIIDVKFVNGEKNRYEFPLVPEITPSSNQTPIPIIPTSPFSIPFGEFEINLLPIILPLPILIILIYASRKAKRIFRLVLNAIIFVFRKILFTVVFLSM
jgi:hypothetical protein